MDTNSSQFILYYSLPSPFSQDEVSREDRFNGITDALSAAVRIVQEGGNPSGLLHDETWLFYGDDLKETLRLLSAKAGGLTGAALTASVRNALPEVLTKELVKEIKLTYARAGEAAVYRKILEDLFKSADEAIKQNNINLLHTIIGHSFWNVPNEDDVTRWGKDFLYARQRDGRWLHHTKKALEKIKTTAEKFEAPQDSPNNKLKQEIIKAAEDGLITHL